MYARQSERVRTFCQFELRDREEAEDAAQTTFQYALRAIRSGTVPEKEIPWLLAIARNVCREHGRRARQREQTDLYDPHVLAEIIIDRPRESEELIGLETALSRLTARQRIAILLRDWRGLSYQEISRELGLSRSAVEALVFRARRSLARELDADTAGGTKPRARVLDLSFLFGTLRSFFAAASPVKVASTIAALTSAGVLVGAAVEPQFLAAAPRSPEPAPSIEKPRAKTYPAGGIAHLSVYPSFGSESPLPSYDEQGPFWPRPADLPYPDEANESRTPEGADAVTRPDRSHSPEEGGAKSHALLPTAGADAVPSELTSGVSEVLSATHVPSIESLEELIEPVTGGLAEDSKIAVESAGEELAASLPIPPEELSSPPSPGLPMDRPEDSPPRGETSAGETVSSTFTETGGP